MLLPHVALWVAATFTLLTSMHLERRATIRWSVTVFEYGLTVFRKEIPLSKPDVPVGSVFHTDTGSFKLVSPDRLLFRTREYSYGGVLDWFDSSKPLRFRESTHNFPPFKGVIIWHDGVATATLRVPVFVVPSWLSFGLIFIVGVLGVDAFVTARGVGFFLLALLVLGVLILSGVNCSYVCARAALDELLSSESGATSLTSASSRTP